MQAPQPSISGTRDYAGEDAVALQTARDAIEATLRRYAYVPVDPPILESSSPFLNRSGEDIRRHMYIFPDPAGREVCLRPELTIPVCRAYLRQRQSARPFGGAVGGEARLCYFGPAFRYEPTSDGRYRQFYQAGAELIGAQWQEAADAEILAIALDSLEAAGVARTRVEIGDVDIRNAFIDQLPVSDRSKTRIRRVALRNQKESPLVSAMNKGRASAPDASNEFGELASVLASVDPAKAELLIREVFALADVRHVGGRTAEEIVERLTSRTAQQAAEPVSAELMQGVRDLLDIRGKPAAAFKAIRDHFRKFGIASIDSVLERCETRLKYFEVYHGRSAALEFNVGLRRGLEYYTGFLFEIYAADQGQIGHLCGGGRYDNLLEGLGANVSIPAVGFGIGLDRLLLALQGSPIAAAREPLIPTALVVACQPRYEEGIRASAALRDAGWSVELDASGSDQKKALADAARRKIPFIAFTGETRLKQDQVRLRRVKDGSDRVVPLAALAGEAQSLLGGKPSGKRP